MTEDNLIALSWLLAIIQSSSSRRTTRLVFQVLSNVTFSIPLLSLTSFASSLLGVSIYLCLSQFFQFHAASFGPFEAFLPSFSFFRYKSVPRHGAKNILPVRDLRTVPAAITSHMITHITVNTWHGDVSITRGKGSKCQLRRGWTYN
jgi:hypothetical protein